MKKLKYRHLTDDDKQQICGWKCTGEYEIYNLPSYDVMKARHIGFMDPNNEKNYFAFLDEEVGIPKGFQAGYKADCSEVLVGFVNILEKDTEVFIGVGVSPTLCEKHYGRRILEEAYRISKQLYPEKSLYLEVRAWNTRAITCYKNAGFHIDGEQYELTTSNGTCTFFRMVRE